MFSTYFTPPEDPSIDQSKEVSLTQQSDVPECDINCIVNRAMITGMVEPSLIRQVSNFMDVTSEALGAETFFDAQIKHREGVEAFEALPSSIRNRFHNSPQELLDFVSDEKNRPEAEKLGLLERIISESPKVGTGGSLDITVPTDTKTDVEVS